MNGIFTRSRWRLARWNLAVMALTLVLLCAALYGAFYSSLLSQVDRSLEGNAQEAIHEAGEQQSHFGREGYEGGFFALVIDKTGQLVENPQQVQVSSLKLAQPGQQAHFETVLIGKEPARLYVQSLSSGAWAGSNLVVGQSLAPEQAALYRLLFVLLAVGGAGLLAALVAAWFLSGKALEPIHQAFQRQQEFTADASHEFRTPLTIMRAATDLLARHGDEPISSNPDLLADVRTEIDRLERIAADLLTLARSDAGRLELGLADIDLGSLAAETVRRLKPLAAAKNVSLKLGASDGLRVEADPDRLEQVLTVLLDNAVKHTPVGGEVTVGVSRHGSDGVVTVENGGAGIASEHLQRIFDRFYRGDRARRRDGGAGLGLAIAKALVDAHGGRLTVESKEGQGTTATVTLRLANAPSFASQVTRMTGRRLHQPAP
jgi:signal transduction histidine kinase